MWQPQLGVEVAEDVCIAAIYWICRKITLRWRNSMLNRPATRDWEAATGLSGRTVFRQGVLTGFCLLSVVEIAIGVAVTSRWAYRLLKFW